MKRFLAGAGLIVLAVLAVMTVRAMRLTPPAVSALVESAPRLAIDTAGAAAHLAGAVKFPTVSFASGGPIDTAAFIGLHKYLQATYPLVHSKLTREVVGGLSLLYTWTGADPKLAPVVLMGHFDVVPVPEPNLAQWKHPPFSGDIADGFIWGRGTLDDKITVVSILEAVEGLLKAGFRPARTVYLTFGHDEEVGGLYGARTIVQTLVANRVKPALVLDEGGFVVSGLMPQLKRRVAVVGISEKGYLSLRLKAEAEGGHSSVPMGRTAIGALSRGIARLEAAPFPAELDGPSRGMMDAMAPYLPFWERFMIANLWITKPLVTRGMASNPLSAAMLRTTTSPTMLSAGVKDNVLPPEASAVVNFRIRPGETVTSVTERVKRVVDDPRISVGPIDSVAVDPSAVSDVNSPAYKLLAGTIGAMVPAEPPPVIPYLVVGGTDAKYWGSRSDRVFRFLPIPLGAGDRERVHGVNERAAVSDVAISIGFFVRLLRGLDKL